ncbi:MAG: hypothetical protein H7241_01380 [Novosphingobium sp.]|nr:hypothetical protein [Novosphingobium sp.]
MRMDGKPIASLSPKLLARKGAAKPAMRPQSQVLGWTGDETAAEMQESLDAGHENLDHDDLGWNDLGEALIEAAPEHAPEPDPIPALGKRREKARVLHLLPPTVVRQREQLAAALNANETAPDTVVRRSALDDGRRAAFTLRVDAERHLRLRMACAVKNRSAQQLVTEALDRVLAEVEGLDDLARRAKRARKH